MILEPKKIKSGGREEGTRASAWPLRSPFLKKKKKKIKKKKKEKKIKSVMVSTFAPSVCCKVMGLDAIILVFLKVEF